MIDDLPLRWVITVLFMLSAAMWCFSLRINRRPWIAAVSGGLHLVMAVAMAVMAWPWGAQLPTAGPAAFFLLAGIWFATLAVVSARTLVQRAMCGYHALMMTAMAWMYLVMEGHLRGQWGTHHHAVHHMSMPSTDMAAIDMLASSGPPGWITVLNGFSTAVFCLATIFWTYRYCTRRPDGALSSSAQATMAAGMALSFGVLLFQV